MYMYIYIYIYIYIICVRQKHAHSMDIHCAFCKNYIFEAQLLMWPMEGLSIFQKLIFLWSQDQQPDRHHH